MNNEILEKFDNHDLIIGVDEVGRGPIAGPVSVAAFAVNRKNYNEVLKKLAGITDSKKLSQKKREHFAELIHKLKDQNKLNVSVSSVSARIIDEQGIVPALRAALNHSVKNVTENSNSYIYLDGSLSALEEFDQETIVKGDSKNWLIGAASVAAKVTRDAQMVKYSEKYPNYGFERHKGYGTKAHYENIRNLGTCDIHRKTWIKD